MPITDEDAALQAIAALEPLSAEQQEALHAINAIVKNGEPFVDVLELFGVASMCRDAGLPSVTVSSEYLYVWSEIDTPGRPTCAGICELSKDPATNKFTRIRLKLSTPLLQYRPRSDTINTLLHEAIHAFFFVTTSWRHSRGDDGTGHGTGFQLLADAINNHGNYEVTIYHTFHDEVDSYRTHVWQCDGPCKSQPPFFGQVKRSINRPPGKGDTWWSRHGAECGGMYTKVSEPELTKKQLQNLSGKERAGRQKNKLDSWITASKKNASTAEDETSDKHIALDKECETSSKAVVEDVARPSSFSEGQKRPREDADDDVLVVDKKTLVECPICAMQVADTQINEHLDALHP